MSEREAAIQAMLAGPGYMDCPAAAGARIRVADCVRRQTEGIRFEHQPRWVPYECRDCEAGRKAMERHQQGGGEDMEPNENGVFVCIEPGCSNLATINAKTGKPANGRCGECQSRIMRQARGKKAGEVAACLVPGCEGKAQCRGLCNYHYAAWRRGAIDELLGPWFQGPGQPIVLEAVEPEAEA